MRGVRAPGPGTATHSVWWCSSCPVRPRPLRSAPLLPLPPLPPLPPSPAPLPPLPLPPLPRAPGLLPRARRRPRARRGARSRRSRRFAWGGAGTGCAGPWAGGGGPPRPHWPSWRRPWRSAGRRRRPRGAPPGPRCGPLSVRRHPPRPGWCRLPCVSRTPRRCGCYGPATGWTWSRRSAADHPRWWPQGRWSAKYPIRTRVLRTVGRWWCCPCHGTPRGFSWAQAPRPDWR